MACTRQGPGCQTHPKTLGKRPRPLGLELRAAWVGGGTDSPLLQSNLGSASLRICLLSAWIYKSHWMYSSSALTLQVSPYKLEQLHKAYLPTCPAGI